MKMQAFVGNGTVPYIWASPTEPYRTHFDQIKFLNQPENVDF
jgi:hypothetical protein